MVASKKGKKARAKIRQSAVGNKQQQDIGMWYNPWVQIKVQWQSICQDSCSGGKGLLEDLFFRPLLLALAWAPAMGRWSACPWLKQASRWLLSACWILFHLPFSMSLLDSSMLLLVPCRQLPFMVAVPPQLSLTSSNPPQIAALFRDVLELDERMKHNTRVRLVTEGWAIVHGLLTLIGRSIEDGGGVVAGGQTQVAPGWAKSEFQKRQQAKSFQVG